MTKINFKTDYLCKLSFKIINLPGDIKYLKNSTFN